METAYEYTFPEKLLWTVYVVDRNKTTFQHDNEVPNLVPQVSNNTVKPAPVESLFVVILFFSPDLKR